MSNPESSQPLRRSAHPPRRSSTRAVRRWVKRSLLAVLVLGAVAAVIRAWLPSPPAVDVGIARRADLAVEVAEEGRTRVRDRFVVAAPVSGELARLDLEAGTAVEDGAPVAWIRPPDPALLDERTRREAAARLAGAVAREQHVVTSIARATASRDSARRDAERARVLERSAAIPAVERERAELAEELASRDLAAAELERTAVASDVVAARAALGTVSDPQRAATAVRAPASGRVLRVLRDSAGPVAAGTPLLELGDLRVLEVVVDVLSSDAASIAPGMEVWLEGWGGARLRAAVRAVEPSAFTRISALGVEEQRVNVIATLGEPPATLGDGFRVEARIVTWRETGVLVVPASALIRDRDRWAVYAVERGRAALRPVEVGHRGALDVELTSGLSEGATVVLHPGDRVTDGARVAPR